MSAPDPSKIGQLFVLSEKIILELGHAVPDSDCGLLPVNSLLCDLADLWPVETVVGQGLLAGQQIVEEIFSGTGLFSARQIEQLKLIGAWLKDAAELMGKGLAPVPLTAEAAPNPMAQQEALPAPLSPIPLPAEAAPAEEPISLNIEEDGELLREFVHESHEHLQNIENGVLVLEDNPGDMDQLNSIFRAFHTFKGGSGFLNLRPINKLAHELESLLDAARTGKLAIDIEVINVILSGRDTLKRFVNAIDVHLSGQVSPGPILIPIQSLLTQIVGINGRLSGASTVAVLPDPPKSHSPLFSAPQPVVMAAPLMVEPGTPASVPLPGAQASPVQAGHKVTTSSVKVDTAKLDSLVDLVGEMVIAQSLVAQDQDLRTLGNTRLLRNIAQLVRVTKELQRTAMSLRMVPIRASFQKMTRLIRDLSMKAGKKVELEMSGEDTELDRIIVEEINDPLVHMMRNSCDHGIEKPDVRIAAGKPAVGTIRLAAFHQGGNFVIQIGDDGGGLDKDRILRKAIEKNLVSPHDQLGENEIFNLIFAPGFSTAEKVTDISGRGVGMDVVRRNIENLRGKIEIESTLGVGTTFTIFLPLTLAIIDGMIVRVGSERYIIPTLSVRESFRPCADMLSTIHDTGELVEVRGRHIPMLRLRQLFSGEPDLTDPTQAVIMVVESGNSERCLLVDELIGKQEIVIKTLGEAFKRNPLLAGAAILGDGRVGLILDVNSLVHLKQHPLARAA